MMDNLSGISNSENENFRDALARLSSKPGVIATILISTSNGSLIQKSGHLSSSRASPVGTLSRPANAAAADPEVPRQADEGLEELATMAYHLMKAAGGLVQNMDPEDETKLLRLRTKKHELVIVPDAKYTFIVVHETPPA